MPVVATPAEVLGPNGLLATRIPGWESRPQQVEMAGLVAQALREGQHAIVEAPTGVGKSFAYLVPLILHAFESGVPAVVSTNTIALQEQLLGKDLPRLQEIFPELRAVLVKGRQNYLSRRRLSRAWDGQTTLFESRDDAAAVREIAKWAKLAEAGDLAELGWQPPPAAWRLVQSDRHDCLGRKCPHFQECFFYRARAAMEQAHLLVVNHHLYFSDLGLRETGAAILPPHHAVVFDEAHAIEDVATDHLGCGVAAGQVRFFLDSLWSGKGRGLLAQERYDTARPAVEAARAASERFWREVLALAGDRREEAIPLAAPDAVENVLSPCLDAVTAALDACRGRAGDDNEQAELGAQMARSSELAGTLRRLVEQRDQGLVHFAEVPQGRGSPALVARPLSVAAALRETLFGGVRSAILTSATLAADDSDRFLFLRRRVGLDTGLARRLDSPFDYRTQATLLLNQRPLDPNGPVYEAALAAWLGRYLASAHGGCFVLFTSYRQLRAVHELARPALDRANRFVLVHGDRMGRAQMLDLFRRTGDAVLFGTTSFWEGVDVPGDALRHVVIAKLPFESPGHPVVEARLREIERRGGDAFMERSVPEAILRLKQGFGRLIRNRTDTGTVAIMDHRILSKSYGRYFLRALPPCRTEIIRLDEAGGGAPSTGSAPA